MISKKILITLHAWACAFPCLFFLSSCLEDEEQVRELRQLREKLSLAEKKTAGALQDADAARRELAAAVAPAADQEMAGRLQETQKRIADLESQLAAANQKSAEAATKAAGSSGNFKDHARQVQENLMKQMGVLSDSLQARHSGPSLEEITVKKIQSGFRSEIVFGVMGSDGQMRNLAFPVEADLEGNWNLPSVEVIAKHLGAPPQPNPPAQPEVAQTPASPPAGNAPAPAANLPASPLPVSNTVVIQWDQTPGRPAVAAAPTVNPQAPAKPAPTPAAPKAPPPPLMPVTKDVQIRFD